MAPPAGDDGTAFEEARAQFPVLERLAYLNAGTFGPVARATHEAIAAELERDYRDGRSGGPNFVRVMELRDRLRERLGALVGVEPSQVALTTSTTDGCNIVLGGLGLGPDDEIVTTTDEHFGLLGALATSGARTVVVAPDPAAIRAAITPRTRLLALSQVIWTTGRVLPVRELRRETGIPVSSTAPSRWERSRSPRRGSTSSRSPGKSGSAAPTPPVRSSSRSRRPAEGFSAPSYFSQAVVRSGRPGSP